MKPKNQRFDKRECEMLLMAEILHQLIRGLSHYLQGFIHPRWCRMSSINSMSNSQLITDHHFWTWGNSKDINASHEPWELLKKSLACFFGPFQQLPPIVVTFQTQYLFVKHVQGAKNRPQFRKKRSFFAVEKGKPSNFKLTKKNTFQTGGEQKA